VASRIERQWVCPDSNQSVPDFRATKVLHVDAVGSPVRKLVERLPISPEIRIDLEAVADIAHDYEWRRLVTVRQETDIVLGLSTRVEHEYIPGTLSTPAPTRRRRGDRQIELALDLLVTAFQLAGLFSLQDEAVTLVKVNAPASGGAIAAMLLYDSLKDVVVGLGIARWVRRRKIQGVAQFSQEHGIVSSLLAAVTALPPSNEALNLPSGRRRPHLAFFPILAHTGEDTVLSRPFAIYCMSASTSPSPSADSTA
jgi:hypothetical protein